MTRADDRLARYDFDALDDALRETEGGEVYDSISELATADLSRFGVATRRATATFARRATLAFHSLQSSVKPFVNSLALMGNGEEALETVRTKPTFQDFKAIVLESETGRPRNPMVNAGAHSPRASSKARARGAHNVRLSRMAGRDLEFD